MHEFPKILHAVLDRRDLRPPQVTHVFEELFRGEFDETQMAAFLIAMRMKGETAAELAAAAQVLREKMVRLETGRCDLLDTCGTGGDGSGTFNISTAAALVAAGAGVPVVKHGNRAMSSSSGSADVLAELGLLIESGPNWARHCLDIAGLAFCFAPHFHPAMKHVGPLRRKLGVRTMLNLLGPLANPAGAAFQLLGVGRAELLDPIAGALAQLGIRRAFVVCGRDGLDEVSLSAPTMVRDIQNGIVTPLEWTAADFGLEPVSSDSLQAAHPAESARMIRDILAGNESPAARVTVANAAAALVVSGRAASLREGAEFARKAIQSGSALRVLELLQQAVVH